MRIQPPRPPRRRRGGGRDRSGQGRAAIAAASRQPPLGSGGEPTPLRDLQRIAREEGSGNSCCLVDLAALDRNLASVVRFARSRGWAVRPALKTLPAAGLAGYVLQRLPEPRAMIFRLDTLPAILAKSPANTTLLCGYPPTLGELEGFLGRRAESKPHSVILLSDSVEHLQKLIELVRASPRRKPIEIALELDVGHGRGGLNDRAEVRAVVELLRAARDQLSLIALLGYDAHARLTAEAPYRKLVADTSQVRYRDLAGMIGEEARDLLSGRTLIHNGPASANYRNWSAGGPATEVSPGSAILFAGYLSGGYDTQGLTPALFTSTPVQRVTSSHPSVPLTQTTLPGSREEEVLFKFPVAIDAMVLPGGGRIDELSGGGNAWVVPRGSLRIGEYALFRPTEADSAGQFGHVIAVREGRVVRRWETLPRMG